MFFAYAPAEMPCIGDRPDWSWMNAGGIPRELPVATFPNEAVLLHLALLEQGNQSHGSTPTDLEKELAKLILLMFVDTHNTGFYVNSYTTKMGVGMAEFMQHLRAGIERLHTQLEDENAKIAAERKRLGTGPKSLGFAKRDAKILLRINTSYTKCKHVGGSELVFRYSSGICVTRLTGVGTCGPRPQSGAHSRAGGGRSRASMRWTPNKCASLRI